MNTKINPRTFTDQIPAYREKTRFLQSLGRQDLADIHDYFFYKRLLLFYNQMQKEKIPDKKVYMQTIERLIMEDRGQYERIYGCKTANPNEKKKMALFLKSRVLYRIIMSMNEALVIPLKQKMR